MTLPEYTNKMIEDFKAKPEYRKSIELKAGAMSDVDKLKATQAFDLKKM